MTIYQSVNVFVIILQLRGKVYHVNVPYSRVFHCISGDYSCVLDLCTDYGKSGVPEL